MKRSFLLALRKFAIACFCFLQEGASYSSIPSTLRVLRAARRLNTSGPELSEARSGSVPLVFRQFASLLSLSALTR